MSLVSHSKKGIRVLSIDGVTYTTRRGAERLIARGLARRESDGTLQMNESDPRFASSGAAGGKHGPNLSVIVLPFQECWLNTDASVIRFHGDEAA